MPNNNGLANIFNGNRLTQQQQVCFCLFAVCLQKKNVNIINLQKRVALLRVRLQAKSYSSTGTQEFKTVFNFLLKTKQNSFRYNTKNNSTNDTMCV